MSTSKTRLTASHSANQRPPRWRVLYYGEDDVLSASTAFFKAYIRRTKPGGSSDWLSVCLARLLSTPILEAAMRCFGKYFSSNQMPKVHDIRSDAYMSSTLRFYRESIASLALARNVISAHFMFGPFGAVGTVLSPWILLGDSPLCAASKWSLLKMNQAALMGHCIC